jgi:hypothetical protein
MSTADELLKLDALRKSGVLTQEEFDAEKAKLLAGISPSVESGSSHTQVLAPSTCANGHAMSVEHAVCPDCGAPRAEPAVGSPASVLDPATFSAVADGGTQPTDLTTPAPSPSGNPLTSMSPARKKQRTRLGVGIAVVIVLAVVLAVILLNKSNRSSPGSGIPGSGGLTIASLQSSAKSQIKGPAPSGFAATGVSSVICNPPSSWAPSKTFTCFAYASDGTEVGEYDGTVEPNSSSGDWQWNARWVPNEGYTAPTTVPPGTSAPAQNTSAEAVCHDVLAYSKGFVSYLKTGRYPTNWVTLSANLGVDAGIYGGPFSGDLTALENAQGNDSATTSAINTMTSQCDKLLG